jgi:hypothetical protein
VTVAEPTPLAELAADPAHFDGQTVRVEGSVSAVCEMKGCWMLLVDGDAEVRVKVPDDLIVFPAAAVGERAAAQGTVGVAELDRESWVAWQRHLAEEAGLSFDDAGIGDGPFLRVEIAGTGAEIPVPEIPVPGT